MFQRADAGAGRGDHSGVSEEVLEIWCSLRCGEAKHGGVGEKEEGEEHRSCCVARSMGRHHWSFAFGLLARDRCLSGLLVS